MEFRTGYEYLKSSICQAMLTGIKEIVTEIQDPTVFLNE